MKVIIEKELTNPVYVDGIAQVLGPHYHIYSVDEEGNKTFVKTIDQDIKEAAREAERLLDIDTLEVAYKKNPDSFKSTTEPSNTLGEYLNRFRADIMNKYGNAGNNALESDDNCSKHYF